MNVDDKVKQLEFLVGALVEKLAESETIKARVSWINMVHVNANKDGTRIYCLYSGVGLRKPLLRLYEDRLWMLQPVPEVKSFMEGLPVSNEKADDWKDMKEKPHDLPLALKIVTFKESMENGGSIHRLKAVLASSKNRVKGGEWQDNDGDSTAASKGNVKPQPQPTVTPEEYTPQTLSARMYQMHDASKHNPLKGQELVAFNQGLSLYANGADAKELLASIGITGEPGSQLGKVVQGAAIDNAKGRSIQDSLAVLGKALAVESGDGTEMIDF